MDSTINHNNNNNDNNNDAGGPLALTWLKQTAACTTSGHVSKDPTVLPKPKYYF